MQLALNNQSSVEFTNLSIYQMFDDSFIEQYIYSLFINSFIHLSNQILGREHNKWVRE